MARISKIICDGCGFEEDISEGHRAAMYPTISRIVVAYGYTHTGRERDFVSESMELCEDCRNRLRDTIKLAMLPENLKETNSAS